MVDSNATIAVQAPGAPAPAVPKPGVAPSPSTQEARLLAAQALQPGAVRSAPSVPEERPTWLPEKFKSPEDLAKAYVELEKMKGAQPAPEAKPGEKPADLKIPEGDPKAADAALATAGFDIAALQKEYTEHGDITPESRGKLAKAGFTKEVVDGYIAGQEALAARIRSDIESVAGDSAKFAEMHAWSIKGLSAADKEVVNKAVDAGDPELIKLAYASVHAKWIAAVGQPPERMLHGQRAGNDADVYTSQDEIQKDMRNPEYKTNESFRNGVVAKLKRSGL